MSPSGRMTPGWFSNSPPRLRAILISNRSGCAPAVATGLPAPTDLTEKPLEPGMKPKPWVVPKVLGVPASVPDAFVATRR